MTRFGRCAFAAIAFFIAGGCSPADPGDDRRNAGFEAETQLHAFTCDDGSSIVTGMNADTFRVDLLGPVSAVRESLSVSRDRVRIEGKRLTVMIGAEPLHLEPVVAARVSEHLSFRGKSCTR